MLYRKSNSIIEPPPDCAWGQFGEQSFSAFKQGFIDMPADMDMPYICIFHAE